MSPRIGQRALVAHPPEVVAQVEAISRRARRGRISGCSHLDQHPIAGVCLQHPSMLRCLACHGRHGEAHTAAEEFGCDICGAHMPDTVEMSLNMSQPIEVDVVVPIGRGRSAAIGVIVVTGWGACPSHFREVTP